MFLLVTSPSHPKMVSVGSAITVVLVLSAGINFVHCASEPYPNDSSEATARDRSNFASKMFGLSCLDSLSVVDLVRSGALLCGFLAILIFDRRPETWTKVTILYFSVSGFVMYFAPVATLDFATDGETNAMHEFCTQALGAALLAEALRIYIMSGDKASHNLQNVTGLMSAIGGLIIYGFAHMKTKNDKLHLTEQEVSVSLLSWALFGLGCLLQIMLTKPSSREATSLVSPGGINSHLLVDGFIWIMFGFINIAFPEWGLAYVTLPGFSPDGILGALYRHLGLCDFMLGLQAILYCTLSNEADKRGLLRSRLVMIALFLPLVILYQLKHSIMATTNFYFSVGLQVFFVGNYLCALTTKGKLKIF